MAERSHLNRILGVLLAWRKEGSEKTLLCAFNT